MPAWTATRPETGVGDHTIHGFLNFATASISVIHDGVEDAILNSPPPPSCKSPATIYLEKKSMSSVAINSELA